MTSDYLFTLCRLQLQPAGADPDREANASAFIVRQRGAELTLSGDLQETSCNVRTRNTFSIKFNRCRVAADVHLTARGSSHTQVVHFELSLTAVCTS